MKFTTISTDEIDLEDDRFRISYEGPTDELVASIEAAGLINPPVVAPREGRMVVVCGWKRILACRNLVLGRIPIFVSSELSDLELFKHPVYENVSFREMKVFEKALALKKLRDFGESDEELIRRFLPLLNIPATRRYLESYLGLSEMGPDLRKALETKGTTFPVLELLLKFSPDERAGVHPLLLPLGQNKQKELLTLLYELSRKDKKSLHDILNQSVYRSILQNDRLSPLQKADAVLNMLREQRSPEFTHWTRSFQAALEAVNLEKGIIINPIPFFEGDELNLSFAFKNRGEFLQKISELAKLALKPEFSDLFRSSSDDE